MVVDCLLRGMSYVCLAPGPRRAGVGYSKALENRSEREKNGIKYTSDPKLAIIHTNTCVDPTVARQLSKTWGLIARFPMTPLNA